MLLLGEELSQATPTSRRNGDVRATLSEHGPVSHRRKKSS